MAADEAGDAHVDCCALDIRFCRVVDRAKKKYGGANWSDWLRSAATSLMLACVASRAVVLRPMYMKKSLPPCEKPCSHLIAAADTFEDSAWKTLDNGTSTSCLIL